MARIPVSVFRRKSNPMAFAVTPILCGSSPHAELRSSLTRRGWARFQSKSDKAYGCQGQAQTLAVGSNNCHGSRGDTASKLNEIGRDDGP
jgi:hypothetical protein